MYGIRTLEYGQKNFTSIDAFVTKMKPASEKNVTTQASHRIYRP